VTTQPIRQSPSSDAYERLLAERIALGRLYMDYLCHSRLAAPQAVMLFRRVLHLDALLASDERYDHDHLEVVSAREDARYHRPPLTVPPDHDAQPCGLCRKMALEFDLDLVLLPRECAA
jgi:hypothetical protein